MLEYDTIKDVEKADQQLCPYYEAPFLYSKGRIFIFECSGCRIWHYRLELHVLLLFYMCMRKTSCVLVSDFTKLIRCVSNKGNFEQKYYQGM